MSRTGIDTQIILQAAAEMADSNGLSSVTLKNLAENLGIRSPSLYNHVKGLEDLRNMLMLYGWKQLESKIIMSAVGRSGDEAVRAMMNSFMEYATEHPGVFEAMQLYNKYNGEENSQATEGLMKTIYQVLSSYNLKEEEKVHTVRMIRSFLQGFVSIVNTVGFGNELSIQNTFEFSTQFLIKGLRHLGLG